MAHIIAKMPPEFPDEGKSEGVTTALDYLDELTELRELLQMCIEENMNYEGNTENIRISLLIDCYLSRSEYCLDELRMALVRSHVASTTAHKQPQQ